ncbi:MAG: PrsW family glutamic-type intramembrane protease [Candidatus Ozemobacteraceae bacterium]
MNFESSGLFLLLILPALVFIFALRQSWRDGELQAAGLAGCCAGALAMVPVKFVAYPMISQLLGDDLRGLASGSDGFFLKLVACLGLVGPIEETAKWCAAVGVILLLGLERRSAAIFLSAVSAGVGFSLVENLDYLSAFGSEVLLARSLFSTGGHVLFAGIAGIGAAIALPLARDSRCRAAAHGYGRMIAALFVAALLHGIFNLIAFGLSAGKSLPSLVLFLLAGLMILREGWVRILVFDAAGAESLAWECSECGLNRSGSERFCPDCGSRVVARSLT